MSEELKPCPFCGGEAKKESLGSSIWYRCEDCYSSGALFKSYEQISAIKAWNTRTPPGE